MDPREKREDESWAEYGARMASMGVAPTPSFGMAGPPVEQFRQLQQLRTPISEVAAAQAFPEPSFIQPSVVPSREVTGGFQDAMVPVQQQNIPQNVVPIRPMDATQAGMGTIDMPTRVPSADIQPPIDVQTQIDTFAPRGDYAQVMADASVAPVAPAPVAMVAQAPAAPIPSPVFVEPAYVAPIEPPPVDVAAVRSTVSAPAPFDFSGVSGGRLAKAREFAGQGMFGKAKFHIEKGGGSWSKAMHRALVGETGMSSVELKQAKNAAVNQAKLSRQKEHAANVSAAQKKHAANVKAAKAKHAENVSVAALTRQATARQAAAVVPAAAATKVADTSYQDMMRQVAENIKAAQAAAAKAASEDRDGDYNTGSFGPFTKENVKSWFERLTGGDYSTYNEQQNFIESLRNSGFISAEEAQQLKGQHLQQWSPFGNIITAAVQPWDQVKDTDWTGWEQFLDAWRTGAASGKNQMIGAAATFPGIGKPSIEALVQAVTSGNIHPSELNAFLEMGPDSISPADIAEIISQVDTFATGGQEQGGFDPQGGPSGSSGMGGWT